MEPGRRPQDRGRGWTRANSSPSTSSTWRGSPVSPSRGLDFTADEAPATLTTMIGGKVDGVLSDMAANAVGHRKTDHLRIVGLVEMAAGFRARRAGARRFLHRQGAAGWDGSGAAHGPQARLCRGSARQARPPAGLIPPNSTCSRRASGAGAPHGLPSARQADGRRPQLGVGHIPFSSCPRISPPLLASVWTLKYI